MLTDEILKDLIEGLSEVSLGNTAVSSDILGDAYEYLIGKFADITKRKKAGEFYTPRSVVRMMVDILDPKEGEVSTTRPAVRRFHRCRRLWPRSSRPSLSAALPRIACARSWWRGDGSHEQGCRTPEPTRT